MRRRETNGPAREPSQTQVFGDGEVFAKGQFLMNDPIPAFKVSPGRQTERASSDQ